MNRWLNAQIALGELGFDPPLEWVFISRANQVLRKAWDSDVWHWPYDRPKPTWLQMLAAERRALLKRLRADLVQDLRRVAQRRITAAYGTTSFEDELALRLRGEQTAEQDAARERLRARYRAIRDRIHAAKTEGHLLGIEIDNDDLWIEEGT